MTKQSDNVTWHGSSVSPEQRAELFNQRGCVLWFTGLSGSGKSTVACAVEQALIQSGHAAFVLDGDNVRHGLNGDLGFSVADRDENIRRVAEVAGLMADAGLICLASFISPFKSARRAAAERIGLDRFFEVYVDTPIEVCEQRDPKGLYVKARAGDIPDFSGISSPYEAPEKPAVRLPTAELDLTACVGRVLTFLHEAQVLVSWSIS